MIKRNIESILVYVWKITEKAYILQEISKRN